MIALDKGERKKGAACLYLQKKITQQSQRKKEKENEKGLRRKKKKKFTPALITPEKTICLEKQRGKNRAKKYPLNRTAKPKF